MIVHPPGEQCNSSSADNAPEETRHMSYEPWHETSPVHTRNHAQPLWHLSNLKASGKSNFS